MLCVVKHQHIWGWGFGGDDAGVLGHVAGPVHFSFMADFDFNLNFAANRSKASKLCSETIRNVLMRKKYWKIIKAKHGFSPGFLIDWLVGWLISILSNYVKDSNLVTLKQGQYYRASFTFKRQQQLYLYQLLYALLVVLNNSKTNL